MLFHSQRLAGFCLLLLYCLLSTPCQATSICQAEAATATIILTGFTRAQTSFDLTAEISGRCDFVRANIGEPVPEDSIFAQIDPTFVRLDLKTNELALAQATATAAFDKKQVKRYKQLVKTKASAQTRLEELELQYTQNRLTIEQLATQKQRLEETLRRHTIHAPAGWLVEMREIEPGEWVRAGETIARVGDFQHLIIPLAVTPAELHYLQTNQPVPLLIIDGDIQAHGTIYRIAPDFDPVTRKSKIDLVLDEDALRQLHEKRGGLRTELPVILPDPMQAFLLPSEAVQERYEEHWVTRENGEMLRVTVLGPEIEPESTEIKRLRIVSAKIHAGDRFQCMDPKPLQDN